MPETPSTVVVGKASVAYAAMAVKWELIDALLGGTSAMRAKREKYLPMEPREERKAYEVRLARSFLFPAFRDTRDKVVAKPFSKEVTLKSDPPEPLDVKDVDGTGRSLTDFCREVFETAVSHGLTHVLVDYPTMSTAATLADERATGAKPMFIHVFPTDLLGWRYRMENGVPKLTQVRIRETRIEAQGDYDDVEVEYVRVINAPMDGDLGTWELWQRDTTGDAQQYVMVDSGTHTYPGVPLVTLYTNRTAFMQADPPLYELAQTNVAHWQSSSDHRNILRFASIGILFFKGLTDEEKDEEVVIKPNGIVKSTSESADGKYIEHTGAAIESAERNLQRLREEMEILGLQPFVQRAGTQTATGKALDESKSHSVVQAWVRLLESAVEKCYRVAAEWIGAELDDDFSVDVYSDFAISLTAGEDVDRLIKMREKRLITHRTFLEEVRRRGVINEVMDVDTEVADVAEETAALMPPEPFEDDADEE